jgi:hypothetical protein
MLHALKLRNVRGRVSGSIVQTGTIDIAAGASAAPA